MTEILTESFCERCGTRYTFETARPQNSRLGRARTFTKGLRNYVLSDDSLSEAMADARGEEELAATVLQLDAFHKTFNFCMSCRQYTCANCWHTEEGRCLTCAPLPAAEAIEDLEPGASEAIEGRLAAIAASPEGATLEGSIEVTAWPAVDLPAPEEAAQAEATDSGEGALEAVETAPAEDVAELAPEPTAAPPEEAAAAPATASAEPAAAPGLALKGLRLGESLDDAIAAYEAAHQPDDLAGVAETEPVAGIPAVAGAPETTSPEAEPVGDAALAGDAALDAAEPTGAPLVGPAPATALPGPGVAEAAAPAAVEPQPKGEAASPAAGAPEAAVEMEAPLEPPPPPHLFPRTAPAPIPAPQAPEPIAATAAPEEPAESPAAAPAPSPDSKTSEALAPGWLTVAPDDGSAPAWPRQPSWPTNSRPMEGATLAGRRLVPSADAASQWAASAREDMSAGPVATTSPGREPAATPTPQPCVQCGLSLSANARFCRRCGARQG